MMRVKSLRKFHVEHRSGFSNNPLPTDSVLRSSNYILITADHATTINRMAPSSSIAPVDLAIIGGGPTGLFGAFYAGMRKMSVKIVDSLEVLGGQLMTLYPEKYIYDVAGFPRVLAKELAGRLIEQGMQYGAVPCLGEQVRTLDFDEQSRVFTIRTNRAAHPARSILIAAGIGAFEPKTLSLANAKQYESRGLYYFVQHLQD